MRRENRGTSIVCYRIEKRKQKVKTGNDIAWCISYLLLAAWTKRISDEQRPKHRAEDVVGVAKTDVCSGLVSFTSKKFDLKFSVNRSEFFGKERHNIFYGTPYHIR